MGVALFESQPLLRIHIGYDTVPIPFDIATINYVLPGLYEHYGWVNKNMSLNAYFNEVHVSNYYPENREIGITGSLDFQLVVNGGYLNGTD